MKGTTPAHFTYMIREIGTDEDIAVNLNNISTKRLQELKKDAKEWCDDNGL